MERTSKRHRRSYQRLRVTRTPRPDEFSALWRQASVPAARRKIRLKPQVEPFDKPKGNDSYLRGAAVPYNALCIPMLRYHPEEE